MEVFVLTRYIQWITISSTGSYTYHKDYFLTNSSPPFFSFDKTCWCLKVILKVKQIILMIPKSRCFCPLCCFFSSVLLRILGYQKNLTAWILNNNKKSTKKLIEICIPKRNKVINFNECSNFCIFEGTKRLKFCIDKFPCLCFALNSR